MLASWGGVSCFGPYPHASSLWTPVVYWFHPPLEGHFYEPHLGSKKPSDTMDLDPINQMDMFWSTHAFGQPCRKMNCADVGSRITWTTTFGCILNTALTRMGGGDPAAQGTTWKSIYRCWNFWPRSGEALIPLPILKGSSVGRSWTENDGLAASFLLRLPTSNLSSGDTGSHLASKSWDRSTRRSWTATWGGNGRNAYWHI